MIAVWIIFTGSIFFFPVNKPHGNCREATGSDTVRTKHKECFGPGLDRTINTMLATSGYRRKGNEMCRQGTMCRMNIL